VGQALRRSREAQALGLVRTREEALAWLTRAVDRDEAEDPGGTGPLDRTEPTAG
jgi:hypothetical protein